MAKHYVNEVGNYIGAFEGAKPPSGAIEVPTAPSHALDIFINGEWVGHIPPELTAAQQLEASDAGMIRMIEDLTNTLIAKNVIKEADLPQAAQDKLNNRKALRTQL